VKHVLLVTSVSLGVSGCAVHGAPSFVLFGAYFPAWLLIAVIGILTAAAARAALLASGVAQTVAFPLLTCTAIGLTTAMLVWLIWFAR